MNESSPLLGPNKMRRRMIVSPVSPNMSSASVEKLRWKKVETPSNTFTSEPLQVLSTEEEAPLVEDHCVNSEMPREESTVVGQTWPQGLKGPQWNDKMKLQLLR